MIPNPKLLVLSKLCPMIMDLRDCPLIALKTLTFVKLCYLSLSEEEAAPFSKEEELVLPVGVFSCFPWSWISGLTHDHFENIKWYTLIGYLSLSEEETVSFSKEELLLPEDVPRNPGACVPWSWISGLSHDHFENIKWHKNLVPFTFWRRNCFIFQRRIIVTWCIFRTKLFSVENILKSQPFLITESCVALDNL